jgi:hypothetical protein
LYDNNNVQVGMAVAPNNTITFNNAPIGNHLFFLEASNAIAPGCTSMRRTVPVSVFDIPSAPTANNVSRCGSGLVAITGVMGSVPGNQVRLFTSSTANSPLATTNVAPFIVSTNVQNTTTLWLEVQNTATQCSSATRTPVNVTINPQPNLPDLVSVSNTTTCGTYTPTLRVRMNNSAPGDQVRVYDQTSGGMLVASCTSCSTGVGTDGLMYYYITLPNSISTNTNYFVAAVNSAGNCESTQRRQVQATVNAAPAEPSVNSTIRLCGTNSFGASQVTFTSAMGSPSGNEMRLYVNLNDTNPIFSSNFPPYQMQINNLAFGNYTYYLEARNTATGCVSTRRQVSIEVQQKPMAPTNGGGNSYNAIAQRCGAGQVLFTVVYNNATNMAVRLYRNETDMMYIDEDKVADFGNTFVLASTPISAQTTFYISTINILTGCESDRIPVVGMISPNIPDPTVTDVRRCGTGTFTFSVNVSSFETGSFMRLYDEQTGGLVLAQDFNPVQNINNPNQFTFQLSPGGIYNQTTDFWVAYENSNSCTSRRIRVRGVIVPVPGAPNASNVTRCGAGPVVITAQMGTPAGTKIRLFTESGSLAMAVDSVVAAPFLITSNQASNNTLFIASVLENCESQKTPVSVNVIDNTGAIAVNNVSRCGFGTATFTVNASGFNGATEVRLYTEPQGGFPVGTATAPFELTTPAISSTTLYYVSAFNGNANCESMMRVPVTAFVTPGPEAPVVSTEDFVYCGPSNVMISVSGMPAGATQLRLYNQPVGGNQVTNPVSFSPLRFNLGTVSASSLFYVASANGNCESVRVPVSVIINELPSLPNSQNTIRCGAGVVTFTATMGNVAGTEMRLFDANDQLLGVDSSAPFELASSVSLPSTTFRIRAFDANTGCLSPARLVTATVNANPGGVIPAMATYNRCGSGSVTITLSTLAPLANEIRLYNVMQGGQMLSSSTNLTRITTPFTTQTTTYYLEQYNTNTTCGSTTRVPVEINVRGMVSAPIGVTGRTIGCGSGNTTSITAQMGAMPGDMMYLYKQAVGGTPIDQTSVAPYVLRTDAVLAQTTYYVAASNSETGCESERVPVVIDVTNQPPSQPTAANLTLCSSQPLNPVFTVNMGSVAGSEIRLYTQSTGGAPVAYALDAPYLLVAPNAITTNTTYFITSATGNCESARRAVIANVGSLPGIPSVQNIFRCPAGTVTFTVTPGVGPTTTIVRMYTSPMAVSPAMVDNSFPFTFIVNPSANTTYYFTAANGNCETDRVAAAAIFDAPAQPFVSNATRCGSGNVTFSVSPQPGSAPISEVRLFDATGQFLRASDNSAPFELNTFVTTTTNFIVRAYAASGNCVSQDLQVTATVGGDLAAPIVANDNISQCGTSPANVSVTLPAGAGVNVYDAPSGGNLITSFAAGVNTIQLPAGTYFLASTNGSCESAARRQLSVNAVAIPARPIANNVSFCGNVPVMFTARMGAPAGDRMLLYTSPIGGASVASANVPDGSGNFMISTPSPVSGNATYYIAAANQGCESARSEVIATQNANLAAPSVSSPVNLCGPGEATLNVNVGNAQVEQIRLYTSLTGGSPIRSATAPFVIQTPVVSAPGATFFVESVSGNCVSTRTAVFVSVGAGSTVSPPFGGATTRCGAGPVTIVANLGLGGGSEIRLYNTPTGGSILASDNVSPFELTTNVTTTTTFYIASLGGDGCESQRTPVLVTVSPQPSEPFAANVSRCGAGNATISVTQGSIPGDEIRVYAQQTGGFPVGGSASAPYLISVSVNTTTDFFVAAASASGCESPRRRVTVEVTSGPSVTLNSVAATCGQGGSITALASGGTGSYTYSLDNGFNNSTGTFFDLTPRTYILSVRDNGNNCVVTQNVTIAAPAGPSTVNVTNVTGTAATVNWTAVPGAVSYRVRFGTGGTFSEVTVPANQLSAVISTVPNANYDVQVSAICASNVNTSTTGTNFVSSSQVGQTCGQQRQGICITPVNVQVSNTTNNTATISWTPNEDGQGSAVCYAVRYGVAGTNPSSWPQFLIPHPGCFLQATNLVPGQSYQVQVRTNCSNCSFESGQITSYSSPVTFTTTGSRLADSDEVSNLGLMVYPNPSSGLFNVSFNASEAGAAELSVTDVTGRTIHSQRVSVAGGENQVAIDLSGNPQGVYLLQFRQGETKTTVRIILN